MAKITWTWRKIVALICGFLGIGTLVSCYGVPMEPDVNRVTGTVYGDIDGDGETEPVPGIKVSAMYRTGRDNFRVLKSDYTNSDGQFSIQLDENYYNSYISIQCDDVDGKKNGFFFSTTQYYYPDDPITLDRVDSQKEE